MADSRVRPLARKVAAAMVMTGLLVGSTASRAVAEFNLGPWSCPKNEAVPGPFKEPTVVGFDFTGTGQRFVRLVDGSQIEVESPAPLIGCYVQRSRTPNGWNVGAINRDTNGYYWRNAAGAQWRLTLAPDGASLITEINAPYRDKGDRFVLLRDWPEKPKDCRVLNQNNGNIRTGFPRSPVAVSPSGIAKNLIVVVDFPDAPFEGDPTRLVERTMGPQIVAEFYAENSYGGLTMSFDVYPQIVRTRRPSTEYGSDPSGSYFVNGRWQDQVLTRDIVLQLQERVDYRNYESVSLLITGGAALSRYEAAAVIGINIQTQSGIVRNSLYQGIGTGTIDAKPVPSWKVFAHELGHLFGFADLYIAGSGSTGQSPGPFDLMGNTIGSANEFFGWNRWLQGWLPDESVLCDASGLATQSFSLNKLSARSGPRLYVSQISRTKVLIAELRTNSKFDSLPEEGVLFYVLDLLVPSGQGPISLLPSVEDGQTTEAQDHLRFLSAPVSLGQRIEIEGRVFRVVSLNREMASVEVLSADAYRQAVAAAEVKAKDELRPKMTTITCVRGKVTRKITAKRPKCPAGYKKR